MKKTVYRRIMSLTVTLVILIGIVAALPVQAASAAGEMGSTEAEHVYTLFHRFYSNDLRAMSFSQQADWGQSVQVAMRADFTGIKLEQLTLYTYDSGKNHREENK